MELRINRVRINRSRPVTVFNCSSGELGIDFEWNKKTVGWSWNSNCGIGGSKGGARDARPLPSGGPNSFIFMQFLAKIWKIIAILGVGAPPWGKSWIRHCGVCMAKPETCGVAGGAIGFWVKVTECSSLGGEISTATHGTAGSQIYCTYGYDFDTNSRFRIWTEQRARRLILISILMLVWSNHGPVTQLTGDQEHELCHRVSIWFKRIVNVVMTLTPNYSTHKIFQLLVLPIRYKSACHCLFGRLMYQVRDVLIVEVHLYLKHGVWNS